MYFNCLEHQQAFSATGVARGDIGKISGPPELGDEVPASDDSGETIR